VIRNYDFLTDRGLLVRVEKHRLTFIVVAGKVKGILEVLCVPFIKRRNLGLRG
jgi:hypothetical protein